MAPPQSNFVFCFQFIGFPNEWGAFTTFATTGLPTSFQFIGFPNEWGDEIIIAPQAMAESFQFIGFPNEWGVFTELLR